MEALDAAAQLKADLAYLDPPYNQHSYLGNYHIWESLVRWDKPEVYGVACKRIDVRDRRSVFNSRPQFSAMLKKLLDSLTSPVIVVSFNNEGYLDRGDMESMLASLWGGTGKVVTIETDFKRYVGAQIGIHNPQGRKVGRVSHLRNKEFVYVVSRDDFADHLAPLTSAAVESKRGDTGEWRPR
jgi:adenine-specific DNA-methyltransferase